MPEFTVKEVRMPELHLPEVKRDEIVRALSGVRLPEVDLARARRATLKIPTVTLTSDDIGRLVAAGAAITRFVRPKPRRVRLPGNPFSRSRSPVAMIMRPRPRRSRRPMMVGGVVVIALTIWAILRRPEVRRRLQVASQEARERVATWRAQDLRPDEGTVRLDATEDAGGQPGGIGADSGTHAAVTDGVPAFEESQTPG